MSSTTRRKRSGRAHVSETTSEENVGISEKWSLPWQIPDLTPAPMRIALGIAGCSMAGKTIIGTHIAAHVAKQYKIPIIFILTEKIHSNLIPTRMRNYDVPYKILRIPSIKLLDLLKFFGVTAQIQTKKKADEIGKTEYISIHEPENSEALKMMPAVIVIDTVSAPFNLFSGGRQNFPARNSAEEDLFGSLQYVLAASPRPALAITIHEETKDPTNVYVKPDVKGGKAVDRWHDYILMMGLYKKDKRNPYKWMEIYRWAGKNVSDKRYRLLITDEGVELAE